MNLIQFYREKCLLRGLRPEPSPLPGPSGGLYSPASFLVLIGYFTSQLGYHLY